MTLRYSARFADLASIGEGAFVPFAVLGDPDPDTSLAAMEAFVAGGADMLELGIAFSDPVADGPTIQAADLRALAAGASPAVALSILGEFRRRHPDFPVGLLLYANLAQRPGPERFYRQLAKAGADSVLVADLPPEESGPFRAAAAAVGIGTVSMVTPLTRRDRLAAIASLDGPFLYVVSRAGVTGRDASLSRSAAPLLARVRRHSRIPALLGFGIGSPDHVREAMAAGASGAISGSAAVEIIARHARGGPLTARRRKSMVNELSEFTVAMKRGTR